MPAAARNAHNTRHAAAGRIRVAAPPPPGIESQCRAVVARLEEITAPDAGVDGDDQAKVVDVRALECLPDPTNWGGRSIVPWGHPSTCGQISRNVEPRRAGRSGWYLEYDGALFDSVRDVFVAARLNKPVGAPWTSNRQAHGCGCLTVARADHVALEGRIDVEAQLELIRAALKTVALAAPEVDLGILTDDLFAGQRVLAEAYLWQLETDGFVAHAHEERQNSLMLTAEGTSVLLMLELTKPGANAAAELMSPRALAEAAALNDAEAEQHGSRGEGAAPIVDIPRFLTTAQGSDALSERGRLTNARVRRLAGSGS
jgi:hypothetical protein